MHGNEYSDCRVYFMSYQLIISIVMLNLFIAVIIESFSRLSWQENNYKTTAATRKVFRQFARSWFTHDTRRAYALPPERVVAVLRMLGPPLVPEDVAQGKRANMMSFLNRACIPVRGGLVNFREVLFQLSHLSTDISQSEIPVTDELMDLQARLRGQVKKKAEMTVAEVHAASLILQLWRERHIKQAGGKRLQPSEADASCEQAWPRVGRLTEGAGCANDSRGGVAVIGAALGATVTMDSHQRLMMERRLRVDRQLARFARMGVSLTEAGAGASSLGEGQMLSVADGGMLQSWPPELAMRDAEIQIDSASHVHVEPYPLSRTAVNGARSSSAFGIYSTSPPSTPRRPTTAIEAGHMAAHVETYAARILPQSPPLQPPPLQHSAFRQSQQSFHFADSPFSPRPQPRPVDAHGTDADRDSDSLESYWKFVVMTEWS